MSAVSQIAQRHNYFVLQLDFWDIIIIHNNFRSVFPSRIPSDLDLFYSGYYNTTFLSFFKEGKCPYGGNFYHPLVDKWLDMDPEDGLQDMYRTLLERKSFKEDLKWTLCIPPAC